MLVLLTDTPGVLTADPRLDDDASLIEEIVEVDHELERIAGPAGSLRGSGGMASKLAAAKIAAWSGVRAVIAGADRPGVLAGAVAGEPGVGTVVRPRDTRLSGPQALDRVRRPGVGDGRRRRRRPPRAGRAAHVAAAAGRGRRPRCTSSPDDAVEMADQAGKVFAKGLVRYSAPGAQGGRPGRRTAELAEGLPHEVVHRDDLVMLP